MNRKPLNQSNLPETFSGPILKDVVVRYMVIDPHGGSDDVLHKGYISALESLLTERGLGDELLALLFEDGIRTDREEDVADWLWANQKLVEEMMEREGYRVVNVLKFKE